MNYAKVNKALAQEFGKGQVEVRPPRHTGEYVLWFKSDVPEKEVVEKAKKIVDRFEPTHWFDELAEHTDD